MNRSAYRKLLPALATISFFGHAPAWGQEKVEKFEVTGSHIKRIDIEGPSPVTILDKEHLDRTGAVSVADVLRESTGSSFGGAKENTGSNAAGVAHVNLRGLGSARTLVLLDGRRLPADAITGAVDLNLIPIAAVERIEVLKDGASATYGSDALGGVVNIITRKDFNGAEAGYKRYWTDLKGGDKEEYSIVGGSSSEKSSVTLVVQYRKNSLVYARDRDWSDEGTSTLGSPGSYRSRTTDADGNVISGNWMADPNCPAERILQSGDNEFCTYVFANDSTIHPELEQLGSLASVRHEINDSLTFNARFGATRKQAKWIYAPAPDVFVVPAATADTLGPDGGTLPGINAGEDVQIRYRLTELGNRVSHIETTAFNGMAGFSGTLGDTWDWEVAHLQNRIRRFDLGVSGYAVNNTLLQNIEDGDFNPLGEEGNRGSLDTAAYEPWELSITKIKQTDAKFSGELFSLPGGSVGVALGVVTRDEEFIDQSDNLSVQGLAFGSAGSNGGGKRKTKSAFVEFSLPILQSLELQLAARHDDYSDFGDTTNPKAAIRYKPISSLMFRASGGTGFKAPSLVDLYAAEAYGYPSFTDTTSCNREKEQGVEGTPSCTQAQYLVKSGGNEDLKEEKSTSYNFGVVYQPMDDLSIGVDYWYIKLDNVVDIDYQALMEAEAAGQDVSQNGVTITRDSNGNIEEIDAPLQNLASREVSGVDPKIDFTLPWKAYGRFSLAINHSHLLYYKEEGFPGTGLENTLGEKNRPRWRNVSTVSYAIAGNALSLTARTIAGQEKEDPEAGDLPNYTEFDSQYTYDTPWQGKVTLGAINLTGKTPPLDDSTPNNQVEPELYDQIGRTYYAGYTQTF